PFAPPSRNASTPRGAPRLVWPLLALALIFTVDGIISPHFFAIRIVEGRLFGNLVDVVYRATPIAIIALGMAVVIGTKGIDLSVGAIVAIVGATLDWRIHMGDPHIVALVIALAAGLVCGAWNGLLVAVLDIQPIIATLILMVAGRGIGLMINLIYEGADPSFVSPLLQGLSTGHLGLIPTRIVVGIVLWIALWALVRRTAFGLFLEAVGANPKAAALAGVEARAIKFAAYIVCGFMAAAAGVILTADTHTSDPVSIGLYSELDAILAVVIGGGSLDGGRIYLLGAVLGAVVIQALTTSILTSGLPPEYNLVVKAAVVLVVLLLQSARARAAVARLATRRKSLVTRRTP